MCGEHEKILLYGDAIPGSSPHVRGAQEGDHRLRRRVGIIPACAGSTMPGILWSVDHGDHPRMCGEHRTQTSPFGNSLGSSPHVRGALALLHVEPDSVGIIPACAGSTDYQSKHKSSQGDHPRMCGEHSGSGIVAAVPSGSSPHVRGALKPCR